MKIHILTRAYVLTIEVAMQETILEIKRKVENCLGIPISSQTLSVCDWELLDGLDLDDYPIVTEGTKIDLTINHIPSLEYRTQIQITVKFSSRKHNIEVDKTETVGSLKEKIHIIDGTPIKQMRLFFSGVEMDEDFRNLSDYGVSDFSEIVVFLRSMSRSVAEPPSRKLGFVVQTSSALLDSTCFPLEMKDSSTVQELRESLLSRKLLPMDDYILIHKQRIMRENCSLRWHGVENGDYLYIFKGTVSRG
ncbi:ubiquitin-like domain-containing protein [Rutidosis leptorrhynchoides]|uniref:ubiquitin-like domain-containing protein n=1 Tax=Rutidosis leptorrhynchoides TaxID=125765 RepID=UPI003A9A3AF3